MEFTNTPFASGTVDSIRIQQGDDVYYLDPLENMTAIECFRLTLLFQSVLTQQNVDAYAYIIDNKLLRHFALN